ncbi:hypothetical protein ELH80_14285 [Rhizobium ruizarguesonis]|uniref:hypothetical protein n=1 Tax=Rhizobium ruizarguesonis TaxID=2081791 RepID=UPI001031B175|nr:hypothetical protein [Rhizobium ruizarguesonis]TAZ35447.1 hypothetical protein ELH80_14285 [Rhizobium ruizarguesonis]
MTYRDDNPELGRALPIFAIVIAMMAIVVTLALIRHPVSPARVWVPGARHGAQPDQLTTLERAKMRAVFRIAELG